MSEKYEDLASRISDDLEPTMAGEAYIRNSLRWLDRNPDQVPGRTITESELRVVAGRLFARWPDLGVFMGHLQRELSDLGITHVPNPTNFDRLEDLVDQWRKGPQGKTLTQYLDEHGVKAPGGDDE